MAENAARYVDVILPLDTPPLTFLLPDVWVGQVEIGSRVLVPLGKSKFYTGIVLRVHNRKPEVKRLREVSEVTDSVPVVTSEQLQLWLWMADYYLCSPGLVMRAALPAALKPDGFSRDEALQGDYRALRIPYVKLHARIVTEADLEAALDSLGRARARLRAVMEYLEAARPAGMAEDAPGAFDPAGLKAVPRRRISASGPVLKALIEREILDLFWKEPPREEMASSLAVLPQLSAAQTQALEELRVGLVEKPVALLQGVTGSGKTEIYIHLIAEALKKGGNVLYLLPEIALTTQLIERMQAYFGSAVVVYHSRLSDRRRAEVYRRLLDAPGGQLVMGVRSSVLLPVSALSLVVIDEEHENSFKQSDNAPRYHARDTAIVLASLYGAKTILGSATPSLESYLNACSGKYVRVTLTERYSGVSLPKVLVSDTLRAARRGEKRSHFNTLLLERIGEVLDAGKQVMLFQNRRGFSPYVECGSCGWTAGCPQCNVTLTYHKAEGLLRCHYCGYQMAVPELCPSCSAADLQPKGFGTEKIEEALQEIFPEAVVDRLDADTARTARGYARIIAAFEQGRTDILVGTQMITKGFDFGRVSLVGILNADNLLNYPDFRAGERAFQLMMQVGGRAGRRQEQGTVVIQTSQSSHPVIEQVRRGDYEAMAASQLAERRAFLYPPYCRLIALTLRHRDKALLWRAAALFGTECRTVFGARLLGPEAPPVDRVRGQFLVRFLLKIEKQRSVVRAKTLLRQQIERLHARPEFRYIDVIPDVDPQ